MVDLNIKIPAIEKLLDYTASGIGAIAGSMLAPWKASCEGEAKLISARKDAEARIIQAKSEGESLKIIAKAQSEAKKLYIGAQNEESLRTVQISRNDITQCIEFQKRKRLANIKKVVDEAANMLADKEVADHDPDPDWTARFFNYIQDISSEDMQKIWAKILSGEVERPRSTSLQTMDILRNMTRKDAELFEEVASFVIGNNFIFYNYKFVEGYGAIKLDNLVHLQDFGLVNPSDLIRQFTWGDRTKIVLAYQNNALEISKNPEAKEVLEFSNVLLTKAGKELLQVVRCIEQIEYLKDFSRFLQSENCQLFYLKSHETLPDGNTEYRERIKIEPKSKEPAGATK